MRFAKLTLKLAADVLAEENSNNLHLTIIYRHLLRLEIYSVLSLSVGVTDWYACRVHVWLRPQDWVFRRHHISPGPIKPLNI